MLRTMCSAIARRMRLGVTTSTSPPGAAAGVGVGASCVATGSGTYDSLYSRPIEDVKAGWVTGKQSLEYLINVLRGDAYIDQSRHLKTPFVLYPGWSSSIF